MDQPYAELASISAIVAITIPTVQVIKALVIDVPCLRKVWTWVWVFATSMTLTLIARYGLHTMEGDIGPLLWKAVVLSASPSGVYSWAQSVLKKREDSNATSD